MLVADWETIKRILVVGTVTYVFFIISIRTFGKRSLTQMNAYDFSVTVALGSILASTLTNSNLTAASGIVSFSLLLLLQFIIAKASVYFPFFNKIIKAKPTLLFYKGKYDETQLKKQRITKDDLLQAVRLQQHASMNEVLAIVVEANGQLSILSANGSDSSNSTLENIDHPFLHEEK
ncbi:DUF421 domain-containing protein [Jeotgalibaca caeni]|uniref:DUF421 domain-containing protein n=1 Tax=Jeotgalibaca caeni TaxID=3028623 RepID=UPI00237D9AF5|nr:YetF domain-containing protein [Jeotgalibaca caeni]MDE1549794.1 DUF421 domain-containing protein [Jeotgalibaca caeni]